MFSNSIKIGSNSFEIASIDTSDALPSMALKIPMILFIKVLQIKVNPFQF